MAGRGLSTTRAYAAALWTTRPAVRGELSTVAGVSLIEVDPQLLHLTGSRLREAVTVVTEVRRSRDALTGLADAAGHDGLTEAVHTFADKWHHGLGCLVEDAESLAGMLADSGRVYLDVEATLVDAIGGPR